MISISRNSDGIWIGTRLGTVVEFWYAVESSDAELARAYNMTVEQVKAADVLPSREESWFIRHGLNVRPNGSWMSMDDYDRFWDN